MTEIKIVRGNPDDGEVAAVTAMFMAMAALAAAPPPTGTLTPRAPWDRPPRFQPPGASTGPWWW